MLSTLIKVAFVMVGIVGGLAALGLPKWFQILEQREAAAKERDAVERVFLARWQAWLLTHHLAPASLDPVQATAADRAAFLAAYLENPAADAWMLARTERSDVRAIIGNGALLPRRPMA